jgi:hypothetical protein
MCRHCTHSDIATCQQTWQRVAAHHSGCSIPQHDEKMLRLLAGYVVVRPIDHAPLPMLVARCLAHAQPALDHGPAQRHAYDIIMKTSHMRMLRGLTKDALPEHAVDGLARAVPSVIRCSPTVWKENTNQTTQSPLFGLNNNMSGLWRPQSQVLDHAHLAVCRQALTMHWSAPVAVC